MNFIIPAIFIILVLIINPISVIGSTYSELKSQIENKQTEIQKLKEEAEKFEIEIAAARNQANTLKNQIKIIENEIYRLKLNINRNELEIEKTNLEIESLIEDISEKEKDIERQKKVLAELIRVIYETDQENLIELVLKNDKFSDFFNQTQNLENIFSQIRERLELIKNLKITLKKNKEGQEYKLSELETLKEKLSGQKYAQVEQKNKKEYLLKKTKNQEVLYQKLLKGNEEKRMAIQKEIREIEDKLRYIIDPTSIPAPRAGLLAWPAQGYISQGYGMTEYAKTGIYGGGPHNGIDIANSIGTPIRAALGGKIVAVDKAPYAYGKWIAIQHDNGLTTLYAHLSYQLVSVGQIVRAGQIIGYMGDTGISTGPHLHFTVYATNTFSVKESKIEGMLPVGGSINPFNYL